MKVPRRLVVGLVAALVLVVATLGFAATGLWPDRHPDPYAEGPDSPRLVVDPGWSQGGPLAEMHGTLGVNDQGCVTLSGDVVLAQAGSRVSGDGRSVSFEHHPPMAFGHAVVGGGGGLGDRQWLENEARGDWDDGLVDALEQCLGDDSRDVVRLWFR